MPYTQGEGDSKCVPYGAVDTLWYFSRVDATGHEFHAQIVSLGEIHHTSPFAQLATYVHDSVPGWVEKNLPMTGQIPGGLLWLVVVQPIESDGRQDHAFGLMHGLIFDSNEDKPLPYTAANLDRICIGPRSSAASFGKMLHISPGKKLRKKNLQIIQGH